MVKVAKTNDDFQWLSLPLPFSPYFSTNPASAKVGFLRRYKLFFVRVFSRYKVYCSCAREQHRGHAGTLLPIFKQQFFFRHIFPPNWNSDPLNSWNPLCSAGECLRKLARVRQSSLKTRNFATRQYCTVHVVLTDHGKPRSNSTGMVPHPVFFKVRN